MGRKFILGWVFAVLLALSVAYAVDFYPQGNIQLENDWNILQADVIETRDFNCNGCINPEDVNDLDRDDIEGDVNTFVDIAGDWMSGDLGMQGNDIYNVDDLNADKIMADYFFGDGSALSGLLKLNQTAVQTISNGIPLLDQAFTAFTHPKEIVNKEYVDQAVTAFGARYYMIDTSDVNNYKLTSLSPSNVMGWISAESERPEKLLAGVYDWEIYAEKTDGTKDLRLYWQLIELKSDLTEIIIGTSSETDEITSKVRLTSHIVLNDDYELADSNSRVVGKIFASVSGSGNAPSLTLYYEGDSDSHWEIPINTEILDDMFVPYIGAVKDTNFGWHDFNARLVQGQKFRSIDANSVYGAAAVALGKDTTAFGDYSLALGEGSIASGYAAISGGLQAIASGDLSMAIGEGSTAAGTDSVAIGYSSTASGGYSMATGYSSTASGDYSVALGYNAKAFGSTAVSIGYDTNANANYATAIGFKTFNLGYDVNIAHDLNVMNDLNVLNDVNVKGSVQAAAFFGDGSGLTGITVGSVTATMDVNADERAYLFGIDLNGVDGFFVGLSNDYYTGDVRSANGKRGYPAANYICDDNYSGSHICTADEIINSIVWIHCKCKRLCWVDFRQRNLLGCVLGF